MSSKTYEKNDYGPPLGSNEKPKNDEKPSTMAEMVKAPPPSPSSPITPITSTNRFTPLNPYKTLITPSELSSSSALITSPSTSKINFLNKAKTFPIMVLEPDWEKLKIPQITEKLFPPTFHYFPNNPEKTQIFYELVLIDTESIELTHTKNKEGQIQYSKIKILKVITPKEWGQQLFKAKCFSITFSPQNYNYYDYMLAWTHALLINPNFHSWFIWFKRGISLQFPFWFIEWFIHHGPSPDLFPQSVLESYNYFVSKTNFASGQKLISFVASQGITWIMAWDYTIERVHPSVTINQLVRRIQIKWWEKFNDQLVSKERLDNWISKNQSPRRTGQSTLRQDSLFLLEKQQLLSSLASASSKEELEKLLKKVSSSKNSDEKSENSDMPSLGSDPYLENHDPFEFLN